MFERVKDYIQDNEFRFTIFSDRIHVVNYLKILSLETERISFIGEGQRIVVKGKNLTLNKLLEQEILILGNIISIEVFYE